MNGKALEARSGPKTAGQIRLPFFYGWLLVGISFVTMAIGVNARTAYSLLFPQILDEFGWDRGVTAGAFSFGFLVSAIVTPCVGWLTDRRGPRLVIETGVALMGAGLLLATLIREPWQLYLTLGALVGGGVNLLAYTGQSLYLTNWFVRRRGLALSIAVLGRRRRLDHDPTLAANSDRQFGLANRLLVSRPPARRYFGTAQSAAQAESSRPRP
jgi:hypothetical protein